MASFDPAILRAIRAVHRDRIDAQVVRAMGSGRREPEGMPYSLLYAGCWLVANGLPHDEPCYGETMFRESTEGYRAFFEGCGSETQAEILEAGHRAIFGGRHPIWGNDIERARRNRELNTRMRAVCGEAA